MAAGEPERQRRASARRGTARHPVGGQRHRGRESPHGHRTHRSIRHRGGGGVDGGVDGGGGGGGGVRGRWGGGGGGGAGGARTVLHLDLPGKMATAGPPSWYDMFIMTSSY